MTYQNKIEPNENSLIHTVKSFIPEEDRDLFQKFLYRAGAGYHRQPQQLNRTAPNGARAGAGHHRHPQQHS